jgi:hypothetical protein
VKRETGNVKRTAGHRFSSHQTAAPRFGLLLAVIGGFVVAGVPLVALAWHNLNHLLAGDIRPAPFGILVAAGSGLAALLVVLAKVIDRLTGVKREP